jgi:hypothetical protein
VQVDRQTVINGRREIRLRHRAALIVGDRDERHVVKTEIERQQVGQILAAVQGGDGAIRNRPEQRKLKLIDMEVQDVKVIGVLTHAIEHQHVIGDRIDDAGVEPQRLGHAGHEIGRRDRIAAGKQGHIVAQRNKLFGQIGDNPLGAAIKPWRHALDQRRDLRDFHGSPDWSEPFNEPKVPQCTVPLGINLSLSFSEPPQQLPPSSRTGLRSPSIYCHDPSEGREPPT